jgi:26S proteasome regulatory subunit N2
MTFASTKNKEILDFIIESYKNPSINSDEAIIHGACLGIGICGMGSQDDSLYDDMKNVLCTDQAVTGEAAALALGLIMAGSDNDNAISDLVEYS